MSSPGQLSELESLRSQVADLTHALAQRDRSMQDLREQSHLLRTIVEGTAAETGDDFFASLVTQLTSTLQVQYAVIGEVREGRPKSVRTVAVSAGGTLVDNFEYELSHTPCAIALTQTFACFDRDVQVVFPQFQRLADLRAESYCGVPLRTKGGAVIGLLAVMDIKPRQYGDEMRSLLGVFAPRVAVELERRRAELDRAQVLADLDNVMETVPDVMFTLDMRSNLVKWNRRLGEVTGYSSEELLNKPALSFVPPEEQTRTAAAIQRAFTEGYAELDGQMLTKDLRTIPYHWTGALLKNAQGEPIGITGVGRDVSEKKQAEEELTRQRRHLIDAHIGSCAEITERKHLEQEVQGTNHLLSSILENLPAMVFVKDAKDLRFVHFNPAAETLIGHSKQEMLGKNDYDFFPKAEADFFTAKDREVLESGQLLDIPEEPIETKEKGLRILHTKKVPILDQTGRPQYLLGISEDITASRQAENALQALTVETASVTGEEFFPVFVRQLAAVVGTRYAFVTELVGDEQARARVLAIWMGDRLGNPFEYDLAHTPCKVVFDQGSSYHPDSVQEIYPNDKDLVALEVTTYLGVALNSSSGRRIGHLCVLDDKPLSNKNTAIALMKVFAARAAAELERKRADAALRASEERYRALYDDTPTMYFTLTTDGTVLSVNRFGAEQLGYRVEELVGHSVLSIFYKEDKEAVAACLSKCLGRPEAAQRWEFRKVRKDGAVIWVRETAHVGQSSTGETVVLVTCEDITAQKLAEAQQARQYDQLQAIFRMTLTLSHATSLDDIYREAIDCLQQAIKADRASILLFDEVGVMQLKASRGLSDRYRAFVTDHFPWARGIINPQPMLVQDAARDASLESYRDVLQEEGIAALAFVPLISSAGLLGQFMLHYDQPHHFTNEEIGVAQTIASHVAFMIQRTLANQTLRESKERLQQALEASRAGTWRVDLRTGLDTRDAGLNQLLGLPAEATTQPVGEWFAFIHRDDRPAMDAAWQHASITGLYEVEHRLVRCDGTIRWVYDRGRLMRDEAGQPLYATGAVIDITERKRMEEVLRQREHDLRAAIEERERISQDLHDGILQSLFAVGLTLEASQSMMSPRARKMSGVPLDQAIAQLNRVMQEIRNFIAGLGSDLLQGRDLSTALEQMLASLTKNQATRVRLAVDGRAAKSLSIEQSLHLLLVIQEAVSNCIRHGCAQEARVSLKMLKQGIRLCVRDNGRGFNPKAAVGTGHGLANMAVRARRLGGRFTVMSKANEGTRIILDLPKEASDFLR